MTNPLDQLGRRERQIMDIVFRLGRASVADVRGELPDPPSYSAVRGMLGLLQDKGYLTHEQDGPRYVYLPTADLQQMRQTAMRSVVGTFFNGSMEAALAAMLGGGSTPSQKELDRLAEVIESARKGVSA